MSNNYSTSTKISATTQVYLKLRNGQRVTQDESELFNRSCEKLAKKVCFKSGLSNKGGNSYYNTLLSYGWEKIFSSDVKDEFDATKGSFENWFYTICRNHASNLMRSSYVKTSNPLEVINDAGVGSVEDEYIDKAAKRAAYKAIHRCISELSENYRRAIWDWMNDHPAKETAQAMNTCEKTVNTWVSRAKAQLYKKLSAMNLEYLEGYSK